MIPDLTPIFEKYEKLRDESDRAFDSIARAHAGCVTCKKGCSDCCHALFDLSLVEAMYINKAFEKAFDYGAERSAVITRASETDRRLTRLKRELYRAEKDGENLSTIMQRAASERIPCPLLSSDNVCMLYDARPITCRLYGVPTEIGANGHVCGFSAFEKGVTYPTVHLDKIQARLAELSAEIGRVCKSRFTELDQVFVPISMAILTRYDEEYLGIGEPKTED